jgi:beta-N-acetylhexosaminidase
MSSEQQWSLEQCIALKLMPDIRFYDSGAGPKPVLEVPASLARGLADLAPCGVILFRENLASLGQMRRLTAQLRDVLSPLALIGVDQEGGRVTRLPRDAFCSFSGNMALAACAGEDRPALAREMAKAQAEELVAVGINVNFVPSLDVNSNPHNPVIHVRAFSDDPELVAVLGAEVVLGLQGAGVAGAVKHFPGHGDTCQDSHTGLPRVERTAQEAHTVDMLPFARVIAQTRPAMVMTAHIQYPALDDARLPGTDIVVPATLSRPILTGVLREQLGFEGVIISDALDMAAISEFLSPLEAVLGCFRAGVDIALMPILVRDAASLQRLRALVGEVAAAVREGELDETEIRNSAARVRRLQLRYTVEPPAAGASPACDKHQALERRIAQGCITCLHGSVVVLPEHASVHLLMPGTESARAMEAALLQARPDLRISWQSLESLDLARERELAAAAGVYIVGVSEPAISAVAMGGAEDLASVEDTSPAAVQKHLLLQAASKQRIVIMLCSPYRAAEFFEVAETVLASYDGAALGVGGRPGPAFCALAAVLSGSREAPGVLPVNPATVPAT